MGRRAKPAPRSGGGSHGIAPRSEAKGEARARAVPDAFVREVTFFGLPIPPADRAYDADVLLAGIPYDGGTFGRPGSRSAPRAVRQASLGFGSYTEALGIGAWDEIQVSDAGDLPASVLGEHGALEAIARRAEAVARSGVVGGYIGGDQTVTLAALRGIHRAKLKAIGLLHIDSRVDTSGAVGRADTHQFSVLRKAAEEGLLKSDALLHVGIRGPHESSRELELSAAIGFEMIKTDDVRWDLHGAVSQIRKFARRGSVYVSLDVSALDPAFAPGASHLRPGGMTTWELQQVIRALVGAQVVGFDVVEISPPFDTGGLTALAGASAVHEILAVISDSRRSARSAPPSGGRRRGRRLSP